MGVVALTMDYRTSFYAWLLLHISGGKDTTARGYETQSLLSQFYAAANTDMNIALDTGLSQAHNSLTNIVWQFHVDASKSLVVRVPQRKLIV